MVQVMDIAKLNNFIFQRKKLSNLDNKAKNWIVKRGDQNMNKKS